MHQPKVEFYLTQKFINLKNWCNKNLKKKNQTKNEKQIERERERSNFFFFVRKLCIEWKRKCQIYIKMLRIRGIKIKEDKKVEKEWY